MKRETKDTQEAHIYFPKEVYEALRELAQRNRRSVTAEVIIAVEKRLAMEKI